MNDEESELNKQIKIHGKEMNSVKPRKRIR